MFHKTFCEKFCFEKHCTQSVGIRNYSGSHFPTFRLNMERYSVSLHTQSKCGKMRTRITPNTDTFYAVKVVLWDGNDGPRDEGYTPLVLNPLLSYMWKKVILNECVSKNIAQTYLLANIKKMITCHWVHQSSWKLQIYFYYFCFSRNYLCSNPNYISRCTVKINHWKLRIMSG